MRVNWKVRLKHKPFLVALFAATLIFIQQVASLFGIDTTVYSDTATNIFNSALVVLTILGVVVDPTTQGTTDSAQALEYKEPK